MEASKQTVVGVLSKGRASQFVGADLYTIARGGPIIRRHRVAIGQPLDPNVEYQRGGMGTTQVIYRSTDIAHHAGQILRFNDHFFLALQSDFNSRHPLSPLT